MNHVYDAVFAAASVLEAPVVGLALLALVAVVVDLGVFTAEYLRRGRRSTASLDVAALAARAALDAGSPQQAVAALEPCGRSAPMRVTLTALVDAVERRNPEAAVAKHLADFDFGCERRLARSRLLVRLGPALGLMGTLIPLSPALEGLAGGDVATLADNLRVAFSITVLGLLVGACAFGISLVRERLYGQDYSDLEYLAALLTDDAAAPVRPEGVAP